MRRHKNDTQTFDELNFNEQAKSINAQMAILTKAMRSHILKGTQEGKNPDDVLRKCIRQLNRATGNIS